MVQLASPPAIVLRYSVGIRRRERSSSLVVYTYLHDLRWQFNQGTRFTQARVETSHVREENSEIQQLVWKIDHSVIY